MEGLPKSISSSLTPQKKCKAPLWFSCSEYGLTSFRVSSKEANCCPFAKSNLCTSWTSFIVYDSWRLAFFWNAVRTKSGFTSMPDPFLIIWFRADPSQTCCIRNNAFGITQFSMISLSSTMDCPRINTSLLLEFRKIYKIRSRNRVMWTL